MNIVLLASRPILIITFHTSGFLSESKSISRRVVGTSLNNTIQHSSMHALIIGGSGRTGKLVIEELFQRGKVREFIPL